MQRPDGFEREQGPGGLEARSVPAAGRLEARAADKGAPIIEGYGSVSEQTTTIDGFFTEWDEEVAAGAWSKTIKEGDIRSMFNHDESWLLGRTKSGSLRLAEDDEGLHYEVDINADDPNAMSVYEKVKRGDVDGSSVWFRVIREEWTQPDDDNGLERPKRRILEASLFETGPVVFPAFEQTSVAARSAPLDAVLRVAGVSQDNRRARTASKLLASSDMEAEIRALLEGAPELRSAVCACDTSRAAPQAPGTTGTPPPGHLPPPDFYVARARGLAAVTGLPFRKDIA